MLQIPLMMIVYSDDSTQVRYSDGSMLRLTPCATSFIYHGVDDSMHPLYRSQGRYQRTQFVTSTHKDRVLQALDFRNRFSHRPYLCEELIPSNDIQGRYSNLTTTEWPASLKDGEVSITAEGVVTVTSKHGHVTMILSNHGRDFTVCYLSKLSRSRRKTTKVGIANVENTKNSENLNFSNKADNLTESNKNPTVDKKCDNNLEDSIVNVNSNNGTITDNIYISQSTEMAHVKNKISETDCRIQTGFTVSTNSAFHQYANDLKKSDGDISLVDSCHSDTRDLNDTYEELNIKGHPESSPGRKENSASDSHRRNSVVTSEAKCVKIANDHDFIKSGINYDIASVNSSFESTLIISNDDNAKSHKNTENVRINHDKDPNFSNDAALNVQENSKELPSINKSAENPHHSQLSNNCSKDNSTLTYKTDINHEKCASKNDSTKSGRRTLYTWVTVHCSTLECPVEWRYALTLAQQAQLRFIRQGNVTISEDRTTHEPLPHSNKSALPEPLPLSCPGQHLHRISHQSEDDSQSGQLKVVLLDGVIYRFTGIWPTKSVDIFPGDGSVIYSDKVTGQYYTHVTGICKQDWKSYSVKCLPPNHPNQPYSISKLISTASRYMSLMGECEKIEPCWKFQPVAPKATKSQIVEECSIPKIGRYRAYNNGLVTVLFHDRTLLEITADLTSRKSQQTSQNTDDCSSDLSTGNLSRSSDGMDGFTSEGYGKLMLPSGHYVMVSLNNPGQYQWHVSMAKEWVDWVNAAPSTRNSRAFCNDWKNVDGHMAVEKELQKINCFNYILDNSSFNPAHSTGNPRSTQTSQQQPTLHHPPHVSSTIKPPTLYNPPRGSSTIKQPTLHHPPYSSSTSKQCHDITMSFDNCQDVIAALDRTSRVINDIDTLLSTPGMSK